MSSDDEWGHDPSVQIMRRVFKHMEAIQGELLKASSVSPYESRLRLWRENALTSFEKSWAVAARSGMELGEEKLATLYALCLSRAIRFDGIRVAAEILPKDEQIEMLIAKALP